MLASYNNSNMWKSNNLNTIECLEITHEYFEKESKQKIKYSHELQQPKGVWEIRKKPLMNTQKL